MSRFSCALALLVLLECGCGSPAGGSDPNVTTNQSGGGSPQSGGTPQECGLSTANDANCGNVASTVYATETMTNGIAISDCGTYIAGQDYFLTRNLTNGGSTSTACITFDGNAPNTKLDGRGFSINGLVTSTPGSFNPNGSHLFNFTIVCDATGAVAAGCIDLRGSVPYSAPFELHHITATNMMANTVTGGVVFVNWSGTDSGASTVGVRAYALTLTMPNANPSAQRTWLLELLTSVRIEAYHNLLACGDGVLCNSAALQGLMAYGARNPYFHHNRIKPGFNNTLSGDSMRAMLFDATSDGGTMEFNIVSPVSSNRCVRLRDVGSARVNIRNNQCLLATGPGSNITSEFQVFHLLDGDPFSGVTLTRAGNVVTAGILGHQMKAGDVVTVAGASASDFNGTFTLATVVPGVSVSWNQAGVDGLTTASMTYATKADILLTGNTTTVDAAAHGVGRIYYVKGSSGTGVVVSGDTVKCATGSCSGLYVGFHRDNGTASHWTIKNITSDFPLTGTLHQEPGNNTTNYCGGPTPGDTNGTYNLLNPCN